MDLSSVSHSVFEERIGEIFTLSTEGGGTTELELVQVTLRGQPPAESGGRQAFSVVFQTSLEPVLEQQIYRIENEHLGSAELFLVPLGPADGRMQYEAIFN